MKLRVAQVNCVIDELDRDAPELLQAWNTIPFVAEAATLAGAEVHVVQASRTPRLHRAAGVSYSFVREPRLRRGSGAGMMPWRVAAEIRRIQPDVVHFHGLEAPAHLSAASHCGVPTLVQDHVSNLSRRMKWARRWSLRQVAACVFTSAEQAEPLVQAGHMPAGIRIFEIPESTSLFTPGDRAEAREQASVIGDPAVLWVGRLDANKDPLTILQAVRLALSDLPDLHLWCAFGDSPLLAEVTLLLQGCPELARRVHLLGWVSHAGVETLGRACDLFVLGSHRESTGYALLEALACGAVPIVSDIPSFRNIIGASGIGALVKPGDVAGFAAGIVSQAKALDTRSRAIVRAHFDAHLSQMALGRKLLAAYEELAAGRIGHCPSGDCTAA